MSDMKSIRVINFSGRTSDWEGWSKKILARSKRKFYKKLLIGKETEESDFKILKQQTSGLNKIEEIQEKLKHRFKRIDKRLRKEDLRRSSHFDQKGF